MGTDTSHSDGASLRHRTGRLLGIEVDPSPPTERIGSAIGAALTIVVISLVCHQVLGLDGAEALVASMAASAVIVFTAPHNQFAQPWPVMVGQCTSAFVGVLCARFVSQTEIAAFLAVALAVIAMRSLRALHPPAAATALVAVVGGDAIRGLGLRFVLEPVALNSLILLVAGVVLNAGFHWRRYPAAIADHGATRPNDPSHEDLVSAVRQLDSFVDVTEDDLLEHHRIFFQQEVARSAAG